MFAALRSIIPGTIANVHVKEGQTVKAGEVLVTLDDRLARARLRVAEIEAARTGELQRASAQLHLAQRQLERLESAYKRQAISDFELEEQRALVDQARASHTAQLEAKQLAEGKRMLAEEEFRRMTIYAPFDGVITQLHEKLGAAVDSSVPVVSIANLETLEIEMHTPVDLYGTLHPGGKVELLASAPINDVISAEVLSTSPIINSASRTFRCVLRIENSTRKLPAGFSVTLVSQ
jgi:RND family efflux transporter MFP subunit